MERGHAQAIPGGTECSREKASKNALLRSHFNQTVHRETRYSRGPTLPFCEDTTAEDEKHRYWTCKRWRSIREACGVPNNLVDQLPEVTIHTGIWTDGIPQNLDTYRRQVWKMFREIALAVVQAQHAQQRKGDSENEDGKGIKRQAQTEEGQAKDRDEQAPSEHKRAHTGSSPARKQSGGNKRERSNQSANRGRNLTAQEDTIRQEKAKRTSEGQESHGQGQEKKRLCRTIDMTAGLHIEGNQEMKKKAGSRRRKSKEGHYQKEICTLEAGRCSPPSSAKQSHIESVRHSPPMLSGIHNPPTQRGAPKTGTLEQLRAQSTYSWDRWGETSFAPGVLLARRLKKGDAENQRVQQAIRAAQAQRGTQNSWRRCTTRSKRQAIHQQQEERQPRDEDTTSAAGGRRQQWTGRSSSDCSRGSEAAAESSGAFTSYSCIFLNRNCGSFHVNFCFTLNLCAHNLRFTERKHTARHSCQVFSAFLTIYNFVSPRARNKSYAVKTVLTQ